MKKLEKTLKALANRRRLMILQYLKRQSTASVADIAHEINLSFRATSKHLAVLSAIDILDKEQIGPQVFYRIAPTRDLAVKQTLSLL